MGFGIKIKRNVDLLKNSLEKDEFNLLDVKATDLFCCIKIVYARVNGGRMPVLVAKAVKQVAPSLLIIRLGQST